MSKELDTKTNFLANNIYKMLLKMDENTDKWEIAKKIAVMSQGRKSFSKFYNSDEARRERNGE